MRLQIFSIGFLAAVAGVGCLKVGKTVAKQSSKLVSGGAAKSLAGRSTSKVGNQALQQMGDQLIAKGAKSGLKFAVKTGSKQMRDDKQENHRR